MTSGSQQVIKEWLGRVLGPYPSSDIVSNDTLRALRDYPTLQVKTDAFTYDSGQTALLLLLHGTIPITYRTQTYHIPLNVWFPFEYPRRPPMVFVVPTKDMSIRKGQVVDPGGRIVGEMMASWERKWEAHSLAPLLIELQKIFSAQPPVYARSANPPAPTSQPSPSAGASISYMPAVGRVSPPRSFVNPVPTGQYAGTRVEQPPPPPPPPPGRPRAMGLDTGLGTGAYDQGVPRQNSFPYRETPRPPPSPGTYAGPPQSPTQFPPRPNASALPYGRSTPPRPHPPPIPPHPIAHPVQLPLRFSPQPRSPPPPPTLPPYVSGQGAERAVPGYAPRPMTYTNGGQPGEHQQIPAGQRLAPTSHNGFPIGSDDRNRYAHQPQPIPTVQPFQQPAPRPAPKPPVQDLMSDVDESTDAGFTGPTASSGSIEAPSRPLPPATLHLHSLLHSHISTRIPQLLESLHATTAQLLSVRADLESGEPAIRDEMARLEAVKSVCVGVADRLGAVVEEGDRRVVELEGRGETSVDEVVCSISIVHNQLIDLVAEDNAIEDTIYHLARALDSERIDLDRFLKAIRVLSREQYQKRALIEKIHVELQAGRA